MLPLGIPSYLPGQREAKGVPTGCDWVLMRRVLRDALPRSPRTLLPISLQLVSSGLEPVLRERARARISEGSQKGQGLGVGVRCPSVGGFEPVPSHPEEDPVTVRMTRQNMVAEVHAMGHA